ncbi:hypothetical protein D9M68_968920 [compost metagenome]
MRARGKTKLPVRVAAIEALRIALGLAALRQHLAGTIAELLKQLQLADLGR